MYNQKPHQLHDVAYMHSLMGEARLALLISHGAAGLMATPLPVVIDTDTGDLGTVHAHLARANRQWHDLAAGGEALLAFQIADAYVSPDYYPSKRHNSRVVPTWNYVAVHAYGTPEIVETPELLLDIVNRLTERHEAGRPYPWSVDDAPAGFIDGMLKAIVGLRLTITRLQGANKLSQNRSPEDFDGVRDGLLGSTDPLDHSLAAHMRAL